MNILIKDYTFDPSTNTIELLNLASQYITTLTLEKIVMIVNVTNNEMIYQFNKPGYGGTLSGNILTLDYDISSMVSTDDIQIFVNVEPYVRISDGEGTIIGSDTNPINTNVKNLPPANATENTHRYFMATLGLNGSTNMIDPLSKQNVDGSGSPIEFYIGANPDYDIHIMRVTIIVADLTVSHHLFGKVNPLPNGWNLTMTDAGEITHIIHNAKTCGEVIAQSGLFSPYGNSSDGFELTNWSAGSDAQTITIDIGSVVPNGIRIGRGTSNIFKSIISDDLTTLDDMFVSVIGYKSYPW